MSNGVMTTSAVDPQIVAAMEMKARLDPLKDALGLTDFSNGEMDLFAMVAQRMRLDPFARQIYAIKRKGRVTFQVGIDGFRSSAEETDQYRGSDEPVYGPWVATPWGHPEYATVVVHRELPGGTWMHQSATAHWDEFVAEPGQSGRGDEQWKRMPRVMLAKCAEAAAFRKAFPKRFAGVYVSEEMDQADAADAAVSVTPTTHRDRIAAERARLEAATTTGPAAEAPVEATPAEPATDPVSVAGEAAPSEVPATQCPSMSPYDPPSQCNRASGHEGVHKNRAKESWT